MTVDNSEGNENNFLFFCGDAEREYPVQTLVMLSGSISTILYTLQIPRSPRQWGHAYMVLEFLS